MTAVLQRAAHARVTVEGRTVGEIGKGLLVLLGVSAEDTEADARLLAEKVCGLRIFTDADDKMNRSVLDEDGELLVISNFTLCGDCRKGRRPSFSMAARPEQALPLYELFLDLCRAAGVRRVEGGEFGAHMQVELTNDGPVTLIADTAHLHRHTGGKTQ